MSGSDPIKVSILGATGYGGGELLRLLLRHDAFEVVFATSRSAAGTPVGRVHRNLDGITDLEFSSPSVDEVAEKSDFIIGALPHGASAEVLGAYVDLGKRVVDLSGDFRLRNMEDYKKWYGREHPRPDLIEKAVYGCPEMNAEAIKSAQLVASPGCFATSINLALLPAGAKGLLCGTPVVVAMTGSSGSGAEANAGTHHPVRSQTLRPYKFLKHQHTPEIVQLMGDVGSKLDALSFIPVSAPLARGILACVSADLSREISSTEVTGLYEQYYESAPFVKVLSQREPECASVAGTNYGEVRARVGEDGKLHAVCAIDNLLKGGAGQAIESLHLMTGLDATLNTSPLSWPGMWP